MRKKTPPTNALGRIIWDFRGALHLSREAAAKVLGIGVTTLTSYEKGFDVNTGKPSEPRDNTLELIARRMVDYAKDQGRPLGKTPQQLFEELRVAAGKAPAEEKAPELDEEGREAAQRLAKAVKSSPAYHQIAEEARLQVLETLNIPDDVQDPPNEWELEVIAKIGGMDWGDLDPRKDTWFWYLDKAARRRRLRNLELTWLEEQEIRRERGRT